jgi:serine/threonine-protein kinase
MSPEQLDSAKGVDARTDIWALGVVLYELLTGRTPFGGDSIAQLVSGVLHAEPPSFDAVGIEPLAELEAVIGRAVSKRREDRYANVGELATDLIPFGPDSATQSAQRSARLLAREPSTSLPVSMPSGQRVSTPRNAMQSNRTPSRPITPAGERTPTPRASAARTPTPRSSSSPSSSASTPVSWEQERSVSRRKRFGLAAALLLVGGAAAAFVILQRTAGSGAPPSAHEPGGGPNVLTPAPAAPGMEPSSPHPAAAALLATKAAAGSQGGVVDAGVSPEPPPVQPRQPEPARSRAETAAERERAERRGARRKPGEAEPSAVPPATQPGSGITDFGGRR